MDKEYLFENVDKEKVYQELNQLLEGLVYDVPHLIANLSNASALLNQALENINWVGFYLMKDGKLVLGPFQGKTACIEIKVGKGVCGTAVLEDKTMLVENVHEFAGHIACDGASNSEIVVPIHVNGKIVGVLDIDSPIVARFDRQDQEGVESIVKTLEKMEAWTEFF